jgi:hypothetical protein
MIMNYIFISEFNLIVDVFRKKSGKIYRAGKHEQMVIDGRWAIGLAVWSFNTSQYFTTY